VDAQEEHRHRCEAREWMRRRAGKDKEWLRDVLDEIERSRGKLASERLRRDIKDQWARGNRGAPADWRQ
jgi:hypothetical protein